MKSSSADYERQPWVVAMLDGLAASDQEIRTAALTDGWQLVRARGRVISKAMMRFFQELVEEAPPRGAFAVHALGGTGRQELCPGSDVDIGIIVENIEENEHFFRHVAQQLQHFSPLVPGLRDVVKANAFPDLHDRGHFDMTSLVALLDAELLVGDASFDHRIRRICQQRAAELGLEFIFAIERDLRGFDEMYSQEPGDVGRFHVKNGKGGLRNFQMAMWLYSFERWIPSVHVYEQVRTTRRFDSEGAPTPKVLEAVGILFCVRCWIEQRRAAQAQTQPATRTPSLLIDVADMEAFRQRFGAEGLTQLITAREIVSAYRHETLDRLLEHGVVVPETEGLVVLGPGGLRIAADALFKDATEMFFSIYAAQQRFNQSIDKSVKRAARKHIAQSVTKHTAFIDMLVAPGRIFPALQDWFGFGVLDKLLPGFKELAKNLYQPLHRSANLTRAARALQRVQSLEALETVKLSEASNLEAAFVRQYRELGASARCALRLALLVEEIPQTLNGGDGASPEAVTRYVRECLADVPGLSGPTLWTVELLISKKRTILEASDLGNQEHILGELRNEIAASQSRDPADTIRALALFAYAAFDFHNPPGVTRERLSPEQWKKVQNLIQNLLNQELGVRSQSFEAHFFDQRGQRIGELLPRKLLSSPNVDNSVMQTYDGAQFLDPQRAHRIIHALIEVVRSGRAKVELKRDEGYYRLKLYAWDFPGLFWRAAGMLHNQGCSIRTTDLYGIPDPAGQANSGEELIPDERRLIFDALTFDAPKDVDAVWEDQITGRILQRLENPDEVIPDDTADILRPVLDVLDPQLTDLGNGLVKFSCHSPATNKGMRYAISRLLSERAGANIESIAPDGTRDWPIPRTNFYIRIPADLQSVADALRDDLGEVRIIDS